MIKAKTLSAIIKLHLQIMKRSHLCNNCIKITDFEIVPIAKLIS